MNQGRSLAIEGGSPVRTSPWSTSRSIDEQDQHALLSVLRSENWSCGSMTHEFEKSFAEYCGARHCVLVTNATAALRLALQAGGIGPGDEVVIPGITWPSVAVAILECGAIPVTVDIDIGSFGMLPGAVEQAITGRTRAIVPTHLFSSQCDLAPILQIARRHRLFVIEDCAHAVGARRFGQVLGTFGDAGIFSFNQKKLLSCGEGGCLITSDPALYSKVLALRQIDPYVTVRDYVAGTNLVSEFQAALLVSQLCQFPNLLRRMEERAERLRALLKQIEGVHPLSRLFGTELQTFYSFCWRLDLDVDTNWFCKALAAELGLRVERVYVPLSDSPAFSQGDIRFPGNFTKLLRRLPECARAYLQAVRIRHHVLLGSEEDMRQIAEAIGKVIELAPRGANH